MQSRELTDAAVIGYKDEGVRARAIFDPDLMQWCLDLDDLDYRKYQAQLQMNHEDVLKLVRQLKKQWDGVNLQTFPTSAPAAEKSRLAIYLVDIDDETAAGYKATNSLRDVVERKCAHMAIGSTCETCGKKSMALIIWEKPKT